MKKWLLILSVMLSFEVFSDELQHAYQEGTALAKNHANQSTELLKALDVSQFPGYVDNTPQQNYYTGVTQGATRLDADSQAASQTDVSLAVRESFNTRPLYKINPESASMQKLHQIAENGDDIMHGKSGNKTSCSLKPQTCQSSWQEKTCLASKGLGKLRCARNLRIDVSPYKTESYNLHLQAGRQRNPVAFQVNLAETNTCLQGKVPCYTIYKDSLPAPAIVLPPDCVMVKVSIVDDKGLLVVTKTATCANPSLSLTLGKCSFGRRCNIPWIHSVSMTLEIYQARDSWDDQCQHLQAQEKDGLCRLNEPLHCVEGQQTRVISETPFTRACWKEQATYECGAKGSNTCDALLTEGCEQSASACLKEEGGHCVTYQQTWQCPLNQCTDNQLICGEDAFCLDGNCSSHEYAPSSDEDFKKGIAALSAVNGASKDFDGKGNFIFKGEMLECSRAMLDAKNCCREKGWGIDMNLFHCTDGEKKLGKARENNLVVATGEYCAKRKKWPGGSKCVDHHQTYCVFQSKLARMVQEQGRRNQLGIGFGQGQDSNCSGITPEQLSLINFEAIDFSEFYAEIKNKQKDPDYQKTANGISERVTNYYNHGDFNG